MRLLIVEDEKELCDTIAKSLYDVGYEVDTSYNGSEALEYVLTEEYDLIVLDPIENKLADLRSRLESLRGYL